MIGLLRTARPHRGPDVRPATIMAMPGRLVTRSRAWACGGGAAGSARLSKFAIRGLGAALRQELRLAGAHGVAVCTVLPAGTDTPFVADAADYSGHSVRAAPPVYTPERVARAVVSLIRRPRRQVVAGNLRSPAAGLGRVHGGWSGRGRERRRAAAGLVLAVTVAGTVTRAVRA